MSIYTYSINQSMIEFFLGKDNFMVRSEKQWQFKRLDDLDDFYCYCIGSYSFISNGLFWFKQINSCSNHHTYIEEKQAQ